MAGKKTKPCLTVPGSGVMSGSMNMYLFSVLFRIYSVLFTLTWNYTTSSAETSHVNMNAPVPRMYQSVYLQVGRLSSFGGWRTVCFLCQS